jgi:DNA polymerase elongation subunit (family B)
LSYVDVDYNVDKDIVQVVERVNGKRIFKDFPAWRTFYVEDSNGSHLSIYGNKVREIRCKTRKEFFKERKIFSGKKMFESDFKPENICLSQNYNGAEPPTLHTAFFDIEVDFNKDKGFAPPDDPFNMITAITVYLDWLDKLITLVIPPAHMRQGKGLEEAQEICEKFKNTYLYLNEGELLVDFMDIVGDADVLSGWNSEGFDIPYTIRRIIRILSKSHTRKLCLWDKTPRQKKIMKYGKEQITYDLSGRIHLDYLELYRKYTYHEMHSYSLDAIAEYELGDKKTPYEGTLDQLYNEDFYKFVEYNRQDTALLGQLDKKLRFIDLANTIAHDNTVPILKTMGAVAVTEQAIVNEAHRRGMVVPDRSPRNNNNQLNESDNEEDEAVEITGAAGAWVADPKSGLQRWVAGIDINSLYPSILRALNMSPETIAAQLRQDYTDTMIATRVAHGKKTISKTFTAAQAWEDTFVAEEFRLMEEKDKTNIINLDMEDGTSIEVTGAEVYDLIYHNIDLPWAISANGTVFDQSTQGIIPSLLERWYSERQEMQAKKKEATTPEEIAYWDKRQLVKKINLNSLYGALLNAGCRFYDKRMGQSTTLSGRCITRHMGSKTNEIIEGTYDYKGKSIIYGDTDSIYYSMYPVYQKEIESGELAWDKDLVLEYYDEIANQVNASFADFMKSFFNVSRKQGEIIAAGRENCATTALFIKKKRYAMMIYDDDGDRRDVDGKEGKIKVMGLDMKRSDTPIFMQDFLGVVLKELLVTGDKDVIIELIRDFRREFREMNSWEKGSPKRVNNLTAYTIATEKYFDKKNASIKLSHAETKLKKVNLPGHVSAAINYNRLRKMNGDQYSMPIMDGMKIIVCKLKDNPLKMKSVAYPIDVDRIPEWFQELPFDDDLMEVTIIDKKITNLLGVLEWDLNGTHNSETFDNLFEF